MRAMKAPITILLLLLLVACDTPPVKAPYDPLQLMRLSHRLQGLDQWEIKGRVSITTEDESYTATLKWRQDKGRYWLRLIAPLGQKTVFIDGENNRQVTIRVSSGEVFHGKDIEKLVANRLGWRLPLKSLLYWIKAVPDPAYEVQQVQTTHDGRLKTLQQAQWAAEFRRYTDVGNYQLPDKIFLTKEQLRLRLVIRQWRLGPVDG